MYNTDTPSRAELPSSRQLFRSTIIAAVSAALLLVTVVLPAEYAIDPTGIGRVLQLTQMGEIKAQLAADAEADAAAAATAPGAAIAPAATAQAQAAAPAASSPPPLISAPPQAPATVAAVPPVAKPSVAWRDETSFTLAPGEGIEIKLQMKRGAKAEFSWVIDGGVVNFDTHGDGGGKSTSYEKGRGVGADDGVLEAAFDGNHGWFWRNRGTAAVKGVLRTRGEYLELKRPG